jgi:phosphoribosylaminoimidazole-succinocarboxamide synthase
MTAVFALNREDESYSSRDSGNGFGDVPLIVSGKVRDAYDLSDELLIVATDRISAYDCVMPKGIPGRGKILTSISKIGSKLQRDMIAHSDIEVVARRY